MLISVDGHFDQTAIVQPANYLVEYGNRALAVSDAFETSKHCLYEIQFGNFQYPLKRMLWGYFFRAKEEFVVEKLSPLFVGYGETVEKSKADFCQKLHAGIQDLMFKRPFEFSERDSAKWEALTEVVDITVFKNNTPLVVQQYGVVSHGRVAWPCSITWDNGYKENIDVACVSTPDFITYRPGQPIRAVVRRDPVTRKIIDIPHVEKVKSLRSLAEIENSGLLQSLRSAEDLPETDWD